MKEHVLKEIIKISDQEFLRIMELIRKTDEQIGKYLIGKNKLLFNVSLYSLYPLLFKELVDFTDKQNDIILHSRYYSGWLFILDSIFDENETTYRNTNLIILSTVLSASDYFLYKLLSGFSKIEISVLETFRHKNDFSMYNEAKYFRNGSEYTDDEIESYCKDKYALAKSVVYLCFLCSKTPNWEFYDKILLSHDYFAYGRQLVDEIQDYEEDYKKQKFNVYANLLLSEYGELCSENMIRANLIKKAVNLYDQALLCIEDLPDCGWKRFIQFNKKSLELI